MPTFDRQDSTRSHERSGTNAPRSEIIRPQEQLAIFRALMQSDIRIDATTMTEDGLQMDLVNSGRQFVGSMVVNPDDPLGEDLRINIAIGEPGQYTRYNLTFTQASILSFQKLGTAGLLEAPSSSPQILNPAETDFPLLHTLALARMVSRARDAFEIPEDQQSALESAQHTLSAYRELAAAAIIGKLEFATVNPQPQLGYIKLENGIEVSIGPLRLFYSGIDGDPVILRADINDLAQRGIFPSEININISDDGSSVIVMPLPQGTPVSDQALKFGYFSPFQMESKGRNAQQKLVEVTFRYLQPIQQYALSHDKNLSGQINTIVSIMERSLQNQ